MQSLAVKYRPKEFNEVYGQENIITILLNQLGDKGIKQGYLMTGGAGTGKTTLARLFASKLDAEIIEIDAASNNGVEHVREIRDKVKYKPLNNELRVYIIDEVHMLSTGAFNALLKTLEEPPPHVVFILATTDPQKIPATILSRIQRFDLKRIPHSQVVARLGEILSFENKENKEQVSATPEVLDYIAKLTDGGMRDAISLLDTCISYKAELELADVFEILGTPDIEVFIQLLIHIYNRDGKLAVKTIEEVYTAGKDLKVFTKELNIFIVEIQKLLLFKGMDYVKIPAVYEEDMKQLINHINRNKTSEGVDKELHNLFRTFSKISNLVKYESNVKVILEGEVLLLC